MPKINIGDIDMFYRVFVNEKEVSTVDSQRPAMIVLHGGFGILDHLIEQPFWLHFSKKIQVIYIDQRGSGKTDDGDPRLWTMDQFGDDIYNFSKALKIKHPIVGGVSAGGYASIAYATRHPEHPRALVLVNTEPVVSSKQKGEAYLSQSKRPDRHEFKVFEKLSDQEIETRAKTAAQAVLDYDANPKSQAAYKKFAQYGFSTISKKEVKLIPPARINQQMKTLFANGYKMFDYTQDMPKIICPVIWFAGTYDPLHPCQGAVDGAKLVSSKKVQLHLLEAGAPIYLDAPEPFYKLTDEFLETLLQQQSTKEK